MRFNLVLRGTAIPVGEAGAVLGRSLACTVRLDGDDVSRRHARILVADDIATIEDLGSVHGVRVNGEPLTGSKPLKNGDVITVGIHELRMSIEQSIRPPAAAGRGPLDAFWDDDEDDYGDGETTRRDCLVVLVGPDVAKLLEAGQVAEAARVFASAFDATLNVVKRTGELTDGANGEATVLALRLALATGEKRWVDQLLELQTAAKLAPPRPLLGELAAAVEEVGTTQIDALRACLDRARTDSPLADGAAVQALARLDESVRRLTADGEE
ncbi:MAG: FHA domain-containing protein [Deltaproteobacteria bacterium]|nr:FHA domain-containing protein [Deltaproteobacteria bacterium]